jgi:flagellar biosynthesis protein FlhF
MGEDVVILTTRGPAETDGRNYEVVAAPPGWNYTPVPALRHAAVVALIGPPGAGKTTTAVKLALSPAGFAGQRVGLLTLDTYRAGALEQLQLFADIAGLPLEVAWDAAEAGSALQRLDHCDVILVDTPGRGLRGATDLEWLAALAAVRADETHLVLPACMRSDAITAMREAHRRCAPTHALLTMVDALPPAAGVAEARAAAALPVRWLTHGPNVPADITVAPPAERLGRLTVAG